MGEIEVLPMRKKIMKSFYKAQVLYLCFCSTMQDYKKKNQLLCLYLYPSNMFNKLL